MIEEYLCICVFDGVYQYISLNIWDITGDNQQCLLMLNGYFTQQSEFAYGYQANGKLRYQP